MHTVCDFEYGVPSGCVAAQTLTRNRVGESLADKIIIKLGGAAHYTIAGDQNIQVASRTIHQQLSERTLIGAPSHYYYYYYYYYYY